MDYIVLSGAEGVRSAGHEMSRAADVIRQSIASLESLLHQHQQAMDDWLCRFEAILDAHERGGL